MPRSLKVSFRPTEDGWLASIYQVPGCHVEAPTKEEIWSKLREALREFYDDAESIELTEG
jgi:predicted RNase H-like HicB family nuclease